jgi:uncharacterized Zn finger protein (UPF0148 family)
MPTGICPECDAVTQVEDEIVICPECGSRLRVAYSDPMELELDIGQGAETEQNLIGPSSERQAVTRAASGMADDAYLGLLAQLTGFRRHSPRLHKVELIDAPLIGRRDGYITVIGPSEIGPGQATNSKQRVIRVFVRFEPTVSAGRLESAIKPCRQSFRGDELKLEYGNSGTEFAELYDETAEAPADPLPDYFVWIWHYHGSKPAPDYVAALLDASISALKKIALPLREQCEVCGVIAVSEITLRNGRPGYYCSPCQQKEMNRLNEEESEQEARPRNRQRGLVYGLVSALLLAIGGAYLASFLKGAWPIVVAYFGSGLLPFVVYDAIRKGGRTDDRVVGLTMWIVFLDVAIANVGYYMFVALRVTELPLGGELMRSAFQLFLQEPFWHLIVLIGMWSLSILLLIKRGFREVAPSYNVTFETLSNDL